MKMIYQTGEQIDFKNLSVYITIRIADSLNMLSYLKYGS